MFRFEQKIVHIWTGLSLVIITWTFWRKFTTIENIMLHISSCKEEVAKNWGNEPTCYWTESFIFYTFQVERCASFRFLNTSYRFDFGLLGNLGWIWQKTINFDIRYMWLKWSISNLILTTAKWVCLIFELCEK